MLFFLRPHVVYLVMGFSRQPGNMFLTERLLEVFEKKADADLFAASVKVNGDPDGRYYVRVDVREKKLHSFVPKSSSK